MKNMVNNVIRSRDQQKVSGSPNVEVGEIDTRAPFQSVKAAVSLFGEGAVSKDKSPAPPKKSRPSSENVLDKETQLLLAQRELDKYKRRIDSNETTRARVTSELEKAKKALEDLSRKLNSIKEARRSAAEAAEVVKERSKQLEVEKSQLCFGNADREHELDEAREQYMIIAAELNVAKQLLTKMRQDFDAALDGKSASFQQAAEAQRLANINAQRATELSKEIRAMRESEQQLKLACARAQQQQAQIVAEKDACIQACKTAKAEVDTKLESLKRDYNPQMTRNLQEKLVETTAEIEVLQEEMKKAHASEMDAVKLVTAELNEATKTLQQIAEEEIYLRDKVSSLKLEQENIIREHSQLQEKIAEKEVSEKQKLALQQLLLEVEGLTWEAEMMKKNTGQLKKEAENSRLLANEGEEKVKLALKEAEEAKTQERRVHDEMKMLSGKQKTQNNDSVNNIKISVEEFDSLKKKVRECDEMAETKVTEAVAEVEAINSRKSEADKKLEAHLKAIEEIKEATEIAVKSAEMAEAAQNVVEGELRKWRYEQQPI